MTLIMHDATQAQIVQFIVRPAQALLIAGPDGIGKTALAESIVTKVLGIEPESLTTHPQVKRIAADGQSISIDAIRELQRFLQLKTIGTSTYRRAVIVEHAQALTQEAQNAFLKLLEEPPADTLLILTVHNPRALLPTILSRTQVITAHTPTKEQLQPLLAGVEPMAASQAYFLSGGLPGLLSALVSEDQTHPLLASVATAKEILQKSAFERLSLVDGLSKQKDQVRAVLEALERIAAAGLTGAAGKQDAARIKQWHRIRKMALETRGYIEKSANAKLALSNLFLHL
ncbi:MAG TPA: AAA family ATPase [Patescibacteria group bacterium]|nr:AAA family ATPase [Patescibacteria group bacterium]